MDKTTSIEDKFTQEQLELEQFARMLGGRMTFHYITTHKYEQITYRAIIRELILKSCTNTEDFYKLLNKIDNKNWV